MKIQVTSIADDERMYVADVEDTIDVHLAIGRALVYGHRHGYTLAGADFKGAICDGESLIGIDLMLCDLEGASFRCCDLTDANFKAAKCCTARFTRAQLTNASFEGADLGGACFVGADLLCTEFKGATIPGTDFRGAINCLQTPLKED